MINIINILEKEEIDYKMNRTRQLYQKTSSNRGGYRKQNNFSKNENGSLISEPIELLEKWK